LQFVIPDFDSNSRRSSNHNIIFVTNQPHQKVFLPQITHLPAASKDLKLLSIVYQINWS